MAAKNGHNGTAKVIFFVCTVLFKKGYKVKVIVVAEITIYSKVIKLIKEQMWQYQRSAKTMPYTS